MSTSLNASSDMTLTACVPSRAAAPRLGLGQDLQAWALPASHRPRPTGGAPHPLSRHTLSYQQAPNGAQRQVGYDHLERAPVRQDAAQLIVPFVGYGAPARRTNTRCPNQARSAVCPSAQDRAGVTVPSLPLLTITILRLATILPLLPSP